MAVWQYSLVMLPAAAVAHQFGYTPTRLTLDRSDWQDFGTQQSNLEAAAESGLPDAYVMKWWAAQAVAAGSIAAQIDLLLPRADWSTPEERRWKGDEDNQEDNDCWISVDTATQCVRELRFRIDLRDPAKAVAFLSAILAIGRAENLLVMDTAGTLLKPHLTYLMSSLEKSNAVRFLTNPEEFIRQALQKQPRGT